MTETIDESTIDESTIDESTIDEINNKQYSSEKIIIIIIAFIVIVAIIVGGCFEFSDWWRYRIKGEPPTHSWTNTYRRWHKLEQLKVLAKNNMLDEHDLRELEHNRLNRRN